MTSAPGVAVQGDIRCTECGLLLARLEQGEVIHRAGGFVCWAPKAIACKCKTVTYVAGVGGSGGSASG